MPSARASSARRSACAASDPGRKRARSPRRRRLGSRSLAREIECVPPLRRRSSARHGPGRRAVPCPCGAGGRRAAVESRPGRSAARAGGRWSSVNGPPSKVRPCRAACLSGSPSSRPPVAPPPRCRFVRLLAPCPVPTPAVVPGWSPRGAARTRRRIGPCRRRVVRRCRAPAPRRAPARVRRSAPARPARSSSGARSPPSSAHACRR